VGATSDDRYSDCFAIPVLVIRRRNRFPSVVVNEFTTNFLCFGFVVIATRLELDAMTETAIFITTDNPSVTSAVGGTRALIDITLVNRDNVTVSDVTTRIRTTTITVDDSVVECLVHRPASVVARPITDVTIDTTFVGSNSVTVLDVTTRIGTTATTVDDPVVECLVHRPASVVARPITDVTIDTTFVGSNSVTVLDMTTRIGTTATTVDDPVVECLVHRPASVVARPITDVTIDTTFVDSGAVDPYRRTWILVCRLPTNQVGLISAQCLLTIRHIVADRNRKTALFSRDINTTRSAIVKCGAASFNLFNAPILDLISDCNDVGAARYASIWEHYVAVRIASLDRSDAVGRA
jgi:hypothetical protein